MKIRRAQRPARRNLFVNMNTQTFAGRSAGLAKLALLCLAGWMTNAALAQPTNDNFADAIIISGAGGTIGGSNVNATLETCEASTIYVNDYAQTEPVGASVWYAWTAQASGTVSFNTVGSGFDTVLSVWTTANGLCDASLTNLVADDDSGGNSTSALAFSAVAGTTYYICVEGYDYVPPATGTIVSSTGMRCRPPCRRLPRAPSGLPRARLCAVSRDMW